nr:uncharacterized protein LOC104084550 [Nicotiana tomentosiformis]
MIIQYLMLIVRSKANKRRKLWNKLKSVSRQVQGPWSIVGDFNSIMTTEEPSGGIPHCLSKSTDFITCMEDCGMSDAGFIGSSFTWCNSRRVSKRLDRALINEGWAEMFTSVRIDHLPRTESDHKLLLMKCNNDSQEVIKYF